MRKSDFCISENKDCVVNTQVISAFVFNTQNSTTPLPLLSEISSFQLSSVAVQAGLYQTWSEPPFFSVVAHIFCIIYLI